MIIGMYVHGIICLMISLRYIATPQIISSANDLFNFNFAADIDLPVHVYDTVNYTTQGVQIQANPSYTPIAQSLQAPTGAVPMDANPSYITAGDLSL